VNRLRRALSDALEIGDRSAATLLDDAERSSGAAAERLYALAIERCRGDAAIAPLSPEPLIEWSLALGRWARIKSNPDSWSTLEAAADKAREALTLDAKSAGAAHAWGSALVMRGARTPETTAAMGIWADAIEKLQSALANRPAWSKALVGLGQAYEEQAVRSSSLRRAAFFTQAVAAYDEALREDPQSTEALAGLANISRLQARLAPLEEARRLWDSAALRCAAALESRPGAAHVFRIQGQLAIDRAAWAAGSDAIALYREAEERFQLMHASRPGSPAALTGLGDSLAGQARLNRGAESERLWSLAIERFTQAIAIRADFVPARTALGWTYAHMAFRRPATDAEPLWQSAEQEFRAALDAWPDATWAHHGLGNLARFRARQIVDARAEILLKEAQGHYDAALATDADFYQALTGKGLALSESAGQSIGPEADEIWSRAKASLDAALAIKPDFVMALVALAQGHRRAARGLASNAAENRLREALRLTERAIAIKPDDAWAATEQGLLRIDLSWLESRTYGHYHLDRAIQDLRAATVWSPEPWGASSALGDALMTRTLIVDADNEQNGLRAALEQYDLVLNERPDWISALIGAGRALSHLTNRSNGAERLTWSDQAIARFEAALSLKADAIGALEGLGNALRDRARFVDKADAGSLTERALERYASALSALPRSQAVLTNWGITLVQQANRETGDEADKLRRLAREKFNQALEVRPDYYPAMYNIGLLVADRADRADSITVDHLRTEAIEWYRRTLAVRPDHHWALQSWALALEQSAHGVSDSTKAERLWTSAAEYYRAAWNINSKSATAALGLGRVLCSLAAMPSTRLGTAMTLEARYLFDLALTLQPDSREAAERWIDLVLKEAREGSPPHRKWALEDALPRFQTIAEGPNADIGFRAWGEALWGLAQVEPESKVPQLLEAALEKCDRALELMPYDVRARDCWSEVQLERARRMRPELAHEVWLAIASENEKQIERVPTDPSAAFHWGRALWQLGWHASAPARRHALLFEAAEQFTRSLRLGPTMDWAPRARTALDKIAEELKRG
jgi:tetratricopeptide (TPR) repeat protein